MKKIIFAALLFIMVSFTVYAQEIVPKNEDDFDPPKKTAPFVLSYGGNIAPIVIGDMSGDKTLAMSSTNILLWARVTLPANGSFFIRARDTLMLKLYEDNYPADSVTNLVDLDAAYYEYNPPASGIKLSAGRKVFSLGAGILLAGRGDGIETGYTSKAADIKAFGMYTGLLRKDFNPYGLSGPDFNDGAKRMFAGLSVGRDVGNQTPYLLGMYQKDMSKDNQDAKIDYNSWYAGAGVKGVISRSDYFAEGYYEGGESFTGGEPSTISAFGAAAAVNYYFEGKTSPALSVQYGFASGDPDRGSANSSTGNSAGDDNGFIAFGYFPGGLALRPAFSNIHIFRLGGSFNPFGGDDSRVKKMTFAAKYSFYAKFDEKGVINSGEAGRIYFDAGHGADASIRWAPYTDLSVYTMYGLFVPGRAYPTDEPLRHFMIIGTNLSF